MNLLYALVSVAVALLVVFFLGAVYYNKFCGE